MPRTTAEVIRDLLDENARLRSDKDRFDNLMEQAAWKIEDLELEIESLRAELENYRLAEAA